MKEFASNSENLHENLVEAVDMGDLDTLEEDVVPCCGCACTCPPGT